MKVSIVVCVHNNLHLTRACLDSLKLHAVTEGIEVLVVDDASTDETPRAIPAAYPWVRFLRHESNLGYGGACTWGAGYAQGEYLLLLNNDTVVEPGFLQPLLDRIQAGPRIGLVASRLLYPDRSLQHAGVAFTEERAPFHRYRGFPEAMPAANRARRFQALCGASALVPRSVFEAVNGFSPEYRNGYEDVDQCLRMARLGYESWYEPKSCVLHFESQSPTRYKAEDRNRAHFLTKWRDTVEHDEGRCYEEDGFPSILWRPLTVMRRPQPHVPLLWRVSPSAESPVRRAIEHFAQEVKARLALDVQVEEAALARGALGILRGDMPHLATPVYLDTQVTSVPPEAEETWLLGDRGVHRPTAPLDVAGLSTTDQLLAHAFWCRPNTADGFLRRGRRLLRRGQATEPMVLACLEAFPVEPEPHLLAGDFYWQARQFDRAVEQYQAAATWVEPEYVSLRLAERLAADSARDKLRQVLARKPLHLKARWMLLRNRLRHDG